MRAFVVQMAGRPGSGKSTLARAIGEATGAIVLDKDVIKSATLNAGATEELAGPLAYEVLFDMARSLCSYEHSVILDSPAFFADIPAKGKQIAEEHGAGYFIVQCESPVENLVTRLSQRKAQLSQWQNIASPAAYEARLKDDLSRPGRGDLTQPHLSVDTTQPIEITLRQALEYLGR